jgi:hypothetical protein
MISFNRIVNADGTLNIPELQELLKGMDRRIEDNIFSLLDAKVITESVAASVTDYNISHGLNFVPNCVIIVSSNPGTTAVTLNVSNYTNEFINITTGAAVELTMVVGRLTV